MRAPSKYPAVRRLDQDARADYGRNSCQARIKGCLQFEVLANQDRALHILPLTELNSVSPIWPVKLLNLLSFRSMESEIITSPRWRRRVPFSEKLYARFPITHQK